MNEEAVASNDLPTSQPDRNRHWWLFWLIVAPAYLLNAGTSLSWGMAAGYILIPSIVGYFIVQKAKTARMIVIGYLFLVLFLGMLVTLSARHTVNDTEAAVNTGCLKNPGVLLLPTEQQMRQCCSCYSEIMAPHITKVLAMAHISLRDAPRFEDDVSSVAFATEASLRCAELL